MHGATLRPIDDSIQILPFRSSLQEETHSRDIATEHAEHTARLAIHIDISPLAENHITAPLSDASATLLSLSA